MPSPVRPVLNWLHLCDHVIRDEHGKLSLIGLFESLGSIHLPGQLPAFFVVFELADGDGEYKLELEIIHPDGKMITLPLPPITLPQRHTQGRGAVRLAGMPFPSFGKFVFRLKIDGQPVESPVHLVNHLEARPPTGAPGQGEAR